MLNFWTGRYSISDRRVEMDFSVIAWAAIVVCSFFGLIGAVVLGAKHPEMSNALKNESMMTAMSGVFGFLATIYSGIRCKSFCKYKHQSAAERWTDIAFSLCYIGVCACAGLVTAQKGPIILWLLLGSVCFLVVSIFDTKVEETSL